MKTKVCSRCNNELGVEDFHVSMSSRDGRQNICKDCKKTINLNRINSSTDEEEARLIAEFNVAKNNLAEYRSKLKAVKEQERLVIEAALKEFREKQLQAGIQL